MGNLFRSIGSFFRVVLLSCLMGGVLLPAYSEPLSSSSVTLWALKQARGHSFVSGRNDCRYQELVLSLNKFANAEAAYPRDILNLVWLDSMLKETLHPVKRSIENGVEQLVVGGSSKHSFKTRLGRVTHVFQFLTSQEAYKNMIHDVGKIQDLTTGIRVAGLLISAWLLASDGGSVAAAFNVGANTVAAQVLSFLFSQSGAIAVNVGGQAAINYLKFELNDQDYHEALAVVSLELNRVIDEEMHLIRVYPSGSIDGKLHQQSALNRMRLMKMAVESVIVESLKNVIDLKSFTERTFKSTLKNTGVAFIKGLLIGSGVDPQAVAWSEEGIRLAIDQYKQFSEKAQHDEYGAQVKKINQDLAQALIRRRGKERKSIGLHPDEEEINQELGYMFPRVLLCSLTKRRILDLGLDLQSDENKDLTSVLSQEIHPSLWGVAQQSIGEFKLPSWLDKSWDFTKNQLFEIMLSGLAESELREGLEGSESFKENFLQWSTTNYIDDPFIIDPGQFVLAE